MKRVIVLVDVDNVTQEIINMLPPHDMMMIVSQNIPDADILVGLPYIWLSTDSDLLFVPGVVGDRIDIRANLSGKEVLYIGSVKRFRTIFELVTTVIHRGSGAQYDLYDRPFFNGLLQYSKKGRKTLGEWTLSSDLLYDEDREHYSCILKEIRLLEKMRSLGHDEYIYSMSLMSNRLLFGMYDIVFSATGDYDYSVATYPDLKDIINQARLNYLENFVQFTE